MRDVYDIGIVGGGLIGASVALALARSDASIALIEPAAPRSDPSPSFDDRGLALSLASCRILERLGVWDAVRPASNPVRRVHVSRQGCFGRVRLDADMLGLRALGHVVLARSLGDVLVAGVRAASGVKFLCPARVEDARPERDAVRLGVTDGERATELRCRLLIVADGTHSRVRERLGIGARVRDYGQTALVASVTPARPDEDAAYERFTRDGPLALLPLRGGRCVAVYSVPSAAQRDAEAMDDAAFLARLDAAWGGRFGGFTHAGPRRSYPLLMLQADAQVRDRVVLLGNAAHTIHPNGAQGFNLGLRDAAGLAEHLEAVLRAGGDPGERRVLDAYLESRRADQRRVIRASDGIARLYCDDHWAAEPLRAAGLLLADMLPPVRRALLRHGTGLYGRQPAWVREAISP